jgi:hypothetical protein
MFQVETLAIIGARDFTDYAVVKDAVLALFDVSMLKYHFNVLCTIKGWCGNSTI